MNKPFLLAFLLLISACSGEEPCAASGTLVPGAGVDFDGTPVCLGQDRGELESHFGKADIVHDFGTMGLRLTFGKAHTTITLDGTGTGKVSGLLLTEGARAKTAGGVGLGSPVSAVHAELGSPESDPLASAIWYPKRGAAFLVEKSTVVGILIFTPGR